MNRWIYKANHNVAIDRISDLPSEIISKKILYLLPTRDVVRTSVLSREWRYMWTMVPRFEFHVFFRMCKSVGFGESAIFGIMSRILMLHDGPIYNVTLEFPMGNLFRMGFINNCLKFLSLCGVQEIILHNSEEGICEVPSNLFSLQTLTYCMLKHLELSLPPNFCGFKYLYQLELSHMKVDSGKLENLISLSPSHVARLEPEPELLNELECRSFCHNKLKTVEIEVKTPYKNALGLIRFLLANSSSLEILKFKVDPGIDKLDTPLMLSTSQDLLEMKRATPRVHYKVNEDRQNQPSHEHESDFTDPWQKLYFLNV
ncbi:unnamed protein product [Lupinus luteus]|uniref:F-box domain-containing protein n=1 Tax=Lupinus luteus TaxID=3873 RepID=A0AAV1X1K9_LUPLU